YRKYMLCSFICFSFLVIFLTRGYFVVFSLQNNFSEGFFSESTLFDLAFQMPSPTFSLKSGDFVLNGRLGQVIDSPSSGSICVQYSDCVKSYDDLTSLLFLPTDLVLYFSGLSTSCQKSSSYIPTGSLVQYVENKKLKSGFVASYPKVSSDRDPNNVNHWRWGYYYEVKVDT
ncbi:hypothetical protein CEP12_17080, partial [Cylindrospermopsis raciborskii S14]